MNSILVNTFSKIALLVFGATIQLGLATDLLASESHSEQPAIIIVSATKAGSFYSDDFIISGKIHGTVVADAAIFVAGRRRSTLPIKTHHCNQKKSDFRVTIDASEEPEIRIVTGSGQVLVEKIDVLDYRS